MTPGKFYYDIITKSVVNVSEITSHYFSRNDIPVIFSFPVNTPYEIMFVLRNSQQLKYSQRKCAELQSNGQG